MIKKILEIIVLGLLLSGCAELGHESSTIGAVIGFVGIIITTLVLGPSVWLVGKAHDAKNKYFSFTLWVVSIGSIIFILINLGSIFAFVGKVLGFGN